jgi:hypothetical protein
MYNLGSEWDDGLSCILFLLIGLKGLEYEYDGVIFGGQDLVAVRAGALNVSLAPYMADSPVYQSQS